MADCNFNLPGTTDIAWCPGCGNFKILESLKQALAGSGLTPAETVIVSGIGQAPKIPQYLNVNYFNGLHGRALPCALAVKAANPALTVICEGGDGEMYGEGGNHFLHNIRRNPDLTHIVHNNMIYGLTKGQASPTTNKSLQTPVQIFGVTNDPLNPLSLALSQSEVFVARAFAGDIEQTAQIIKRAISFKGYALIDILQNCVTFNKVNTFKWFKDNSYYLSGHDETDHAAAMKLALDKSRLALGVLYCPEERKTFHENLAPYRDGDSTPLFSRSSKSADVAQLIAAKECRCRY